MGFNFTSEEFNIVANKTFHLMENVSYEHGMNVSSSAPSAEMMTFYIFLFLIVEILGNFLLLSMITYEKYGMDSKKRTVTNQLLSSICVSFIILNVIAMTLAMLHCIYHPFLITLCKEIFLFCGLVKEFNYLGSR
ncbi:MAG: hypothetical protein GY705_27050 [Bacteroidetes bacterium]|nr:hypothetical protein [Bacteroidota bacterium]